MSTAKCLFEVKLFITTAFEPHLPYYDVCLGYVHFHFSLMSDACVHISFSLFYRFYQSISTYCFCLHPLFCSCNSDITVRIKFPNIDSIYYWRRYTWRRSNLPFHASSNRSSDDSATYNVIKPRRQRAW